MVYFTECVHTETTRGASTQDSQETEKRWALLHQEKSSTKTAENRILNKVF